MTACLYFAGRNWASFPDLNAGITTDDGAGHSALFAQRGQTAPRSAGRLSVSLGGRAAFRSHLVAAPYSIASQHRAQVSRPGLQLDRLRAAQTLPQLALALNEREK